MTTERILREAVRMYTDTIEPTDRWDELEAEFEARRRRRWVTPAVVSLAAAAVLAGVLVGAGAVRDEQSVDVGPATGDGPSTGVTTSALPEAYVAGDAGVRLVETSTGRVLRVLASEVDAPNVTAMALTPDRETVYFTTGLSTSGGCGEVIAKVPVAGGRVTRLGRGHAPAVSPDGKTLAFARPLTEGCYEPHDIVVMDLETGVESVVLDSLAVMEAGYPGRFIVQGLAFEEGGRELAVSSAGFGPFFLDLDPVPESTPPGDEELSAPAEPIWGGLFPLHYGYPEPSPYPGQMTFLDGRIVVAEWTEEGALAVTRVGDQEGIVDEVLFTFDPEVDVVVSIVPAIDRSVLAVTVGAGGEGFTLAWDGSRLVELPRGANAIAW